MTQERSRKPVSDWFGEAVAPGETRNLQLTMGESYSSQDVGVPIQVRRALLDGPVVFVSAALHGDEINGTGAVRRLILDPEFRLTRGAIVFVPVLNMLAFERHSRYLPDRRDLNRSFPGSAGGSLASRTARVVMDEIVARCDYGIDLHTAALRRTNYPSVRADLKDPAVRRIALAFGSEVVVDSRGPAGSFRREACRAGCPTIVMEGGEVWKVEPGIVESAARGVRNVLRELGMLGGDSERPACQVVIATSKWVRAERGGFMRFHVQPGDLVGKGQPLATNTTLLGEEVGSLSAPFDAVVIGMTTLPAISPGEPLCNLGRLPRGQRPEELQRRRSEANGLSQRVSEELATSILVVDPPEGTPELL